MDNEKITDLYKIKIGCLWDSLKRFDNYIYSVNFKCGLLATFNSALFGAVILKSGEIINVASGTTRVIIQIELVAIAITSLISTFWVLKSIWPNLTSGSLDGAPKQPSLFFFASIATKYTAETYAERFNAVTFKELEIDLATQVHEVATITLDKMKKISTASKVAACNLFLLMLLLATFFTSTYGVQLCQG